MNEAAFQNYDFKKKIEQLIIWFLPFFILSLLAKFFSQKFMEATVTKSVLNGEVAADQMNNLLFSLYGIEFLDNLVVGIWLYFQAKQLGFNRVLWPIFAFFQMQTALIAFIGVTLFTAYKEKHLTRQ